MSPTRYKIYNYVQPYFLTMTVVEWIPLFINPEVITLIEASLRFLQKDRNVALYAYVIMENHIHANPVRRRYVDEPKHWS